MNEINYLGWWWIDEKMTVYVTKHNTITGEWCESWWICEENDECNKINTTSARKLTGDATDELEFTQNTAGLKWRVGAESC